MHDESFPLLLILKAAIFFMPKVNRGFISAFYQIFSTAIKVILLIVSGMWISKAWSRRLEW